MNSLFKFLIFILQKKIYIYINIYVVKFEKWYKLFNYKLKFITIDKSKISLIIYNQISVF